MYAIMEATTRMFSQNVFVMYPIVKLSKKHPFHKVINLTFTYCTYTTRYKVMLGCWHKSPNSRPSFTTLVKEFDKSLTKMASQEDRSTGYVTAIDPDAEPMSSSASANPGFHTDEDVEEELGDEIRDPKDEVRNKILLLSSESFSEHRH